MKLCRRTSGPRLPSETSPTSGDEQGALGKAHPVAVDDLVAGGLGVGRRTQGDEQRCVVLDGRVGVGHARRLRPVRRQLGHVSAGECLGGPAVEVDRPAGGLGLDAELLEERQAVGQEAGADDQHALVAQLAQAAAEGEQLVGVLGRQRHLQDRDVGLGIHDLQRDPGAVVEPARGVLVHPLGVRHHRGDPLGEVVGRRGLVGHPVVPLREPAEVVDQADARAGGGERQGRGLPVGADDQDRPSGGGGRPRASAAARTTPGRRAAEERRARCRGPASGQRLQDRSCPTQQLKQQLYSVHEGCQGSRQSTGVPPCSTSIRFTRLNGLDPKKPRCADSGLGCTDSTQGIGISSGFSDCASRPQRIAVSGAPCLLRTARVRIAWSVTASQPRPRCEAGWPGSNGEAPVQQHHPGVGPGGEVPAAGQGYAEVVDQLLEDVHQALGRGDPGCDREAEPDRVARSRVGVLADDEHLHVRQWSAERAEHLLTGGQVVPARRDLRAEELAHRRDLSVDRRECLGPVGGHEPLVHESGQSAHAGQPRTTRAVSPRTRAGRG